MMHPQMIDSVRAHADLLLARTEADKIQRQLEDPACIAHYPSERDYDALEGGGQVRAQVSA